MQHFASLETRERIESLTNAAISSCMSCLRSYVVPLSAAPRLITQKISGLKSVGLDPKETQGLRSRIFKLGPWHKYTAVVASPICRWCLMILRIYEGAVTVRKSAIGLVSERMEGLELGSSAKWRVDLGPRMERPPVTRGWFVNNARTHPTTADLESIAQRLDTEG